MYSVDWEYSTPVVINDKVFASSYGLPDRNRVSCYDIATGALVWKNTSVPNPGPLPSVIDEKPAYTSDNNSFYTFNTTTGNPTGVYGAGDGKMNTRYSAFPSNNMLMIALLSPSYNTPDYICYIDAIDKTTGQFKTRFKDTLNGLAITDKKIYVQNVSRLVQARSLDNYSIDWTWNSPSKAYLDTMSSIERGSVLQFSYTSTLLSNDSLVYYYENFFGNQYEFPQAELNSLFILDATNGKKLKEVKFGRPIPANRIGRFLMVVVNGKALRAP
jgi:hypothetical protein